MQAPGRLDEFFLSSGDQLRNVCLALVMTLAMVASASGRDSKCKRALFRDELQIEEPQIADQSPIY